MGSMVENVISQISSSSPNIIRMVRLLRIGRSCRTVRLLRFAPFLYKFRFLVSACVNSLSVLFWALLVLTVLTYIFSVTFLTNLASWIEGVGASETSQVELVSTYFCTLPQTMLTLFMSITGGVNWSACVDVFADVSWVMVVLFLIFIVLSLLAVMNVITSVFVSDAIEVAQQDRDIKMRAVVTKSRRQMAILKEIFQEMDTTNSGSVSSEQFELGMRRHDVMSLFHLVELDVLDAKSFFQLLDEDQDGAVDLEGFVMGCLRMKGNANKIDVGISVQETKRMVRDSMDAQKDSERRLGEIEHLLRSAIRPAASL